RRAPLPPQQLYARHLIEQPTGLVSGRETARPARTSSSASRSHEAFSDGSPWSASGAPRYTTDPPATTHTSGVVFAPDARATSSVSSYRYGPANSPASTRARIASRESRGYLTASLALTCSTRTPRSA